MNCITFVSVVALAAVSSVAVNGFGIAPPAAVQPTALQKLSPVRTWPSAKVCIGSTSADHSSLPLAFSSFNDRWKLHRLCCFRSDVTTNIINWKRWRIEIRAPRNSFSRPTAISNLATRMARSPRVRLENGKSPMAPTITPCILPDRSIPGKTIPIWAVSALKVSTAVATHVVVS